MNWKLAEAINKIKGLTAVQRSILFALAGYANDQNMCWPSCSSIAKRSGVSKRYTILTLRELEKMKILSVKYVREDEKNNTNIYTILVEIDKNKSILGDDLRSGGDDLRSGGVMISDQGGDDLRSSEVDTKNRYNRTDKNYNKKNLSENSKNTQKVNTDIESKFYEFWKLYPRKVAKPAAQKKFISLVDKKTSPEKIIDGLKKYKEYWEENSTQKIHIPHPTTFLNQERFNDEIQTTNWDFYNVEK